MTYMHNRSRSAAANRRVRDSRLANTIEVTFKKYFRQKDGGDRVESLKGVATGVTKLIALSKHAVFTPKDGETWLCKKIFDTSTEPNKGVLFVAPLVHQIKREKFDIFNCLAANEEPITILVYKLAMGNTNVETKTFELRSEADIVADWPEWVKDKVREHRLRLAESLEKWRERCNAVDDHFSIRSACSVERADCLFEVVLNRTVGFTPEKPVVYQVRSLADFHADWPEHIKEELRNALEDYEQRRKEHLEFLLQERVEWATGWVGAVPELYPCAIRKVMVGYEQKGDERIVVKSALQIDEAWPAWVRRTLAKCLKSAEERNFVEQQARLRKALIAGLTRDPDGIIRFQWAGDFLTDGQHWFPRLRPFGGEWKQMPIPAVPEGYWETFLNGLEGKQMAELLSYYRKGEWRATENKRVRLTDRQKEIEETIKSEIKRAVPEREMWRGEGIDAVAVGKCVVFFMPRDGKHDIYVVDNPGPGAIYCFHSKKEAYKLAQNEVTRSALIKGGARRILHTTGWQSRLAAAIRAA